MPLMLAYLATPRFQKLSEMGPCPQCSADITPNEMSQHWRRFHSSAKPVFKCADCECSSNEFNDALVHCLLHGHSIRYLPPSSGKMQLPCTLFATEPISEHGEFTNNGQSSISCSKSKQKAKPVMPSYSEVSTFPTEIAVEIMQSTASREQTFDFHSDLAETSMSPLDEQGGAYCAITNQLSPPISHSTKVESMSVESNNHPKELTRTTTENLGPSTVQTPTDINQQWTNGPSSSSSPNYASCQQCYKPISLHPKRGAIDHVCACRKVRTSDFVGLAEMSTKDTSCHVCGSRLSLTRTEKAVNHVCACEKIKPYGCSLCEHTFTKRSNAQRHTKTGACMGGQITHVEKYEDEKLIRDGLRLCFPSVVFDWHGL